MAEAGTFVIVGGGLAGARAAETLRKEGFDGRVVLIGEELDLPYERPPLTKEYLRGASDRAAITVHDAAWYANQKVELKLGSPVAWVDPKQGTVTLTTGDRIHFEKLLLATGSTARHLGVTGAQIAGVHHLRRVEEADALRADLVPGKRVIVVGGGWIGTEVAASARQLGCDVTAIYPGRLPLEGPLGPELAEVYRDLHLANGVTLMPGTKLTAVRGKGRVEEVVTDTGEHLPADVVVAGIGAEPRIELARGAGLAIDEGVLVSSLLETSAPGIFAAGDIAQAEHPFYGTQIRLEHWAAAKFQGPAAAKSMLGRGEPYDRLPYFYSDQYDLSMEYRGWAPSWERVVIRGDLASRAFLAFWIVDGRVSAALNANTSGKGKVLEALIRSRRFIDRDRLADPSVPLEELAGIEPTQG